MDTQQRPSVVSEGHTHNRLDLVMEWMRFFQTLEDIYMGVAEGQGRPYRRAGNEELHRRASAAAATGERPGDVSGHGQFWPMAAMSGSPGRPVIPRTPSQPPPH